MTRKMEKVPGIGKMILELRNVRGESQEQFAKSGGFARPEVSAWETEAKYPPVSAFLKLAKLCMGEEYRVRIFLEAAGITLEDISAGGTGKEVRTAPREIPEFATLPVSSKSIPGVRQMSELVRLPRAFVPNPTSSFVLTVNEKLASSSVFAGDTIILDRSQNNSPNLLPFLGQVCLIDVALPRNPSGEYLYRQHGGLRMGRLCLKHFLHSEADVTAVRSSDWVVTLGGLSVSEGQWWPGQEGVVRGHWEKFQSKGAKPEPWTVAFQEMARKEAPDKIRLSENCQMVGIVLGWFRLPSKTGE